MEGQTPLDTKTSSEAMGFTYHGSSLKPDIRLRHSWASGKAQI